MKKNFIVLGLVFAFVGAIFFVAFDTSAENTTIAERFNVPNKKDEGASGVYNFDKAHTFIGFRVRHIGSLAVTA